MLYKTREYHIHEALRPKLKDIFYSPSNATLSRHRNNKVIYDGFDMVATGQADEIQVQTVSHALNMLATYTMPSDWIDARTPAQRHQNAKELEPYKPQSVKQAKEHYATFGYQSNRALWSTEDILIREEDEDTGKITMTPNAMCTLTLCLADSTIHFFAHFAKTYKMRELSFRTKPNSVKIQSGAGPNAVVSTTKQVACTLEAIACKMLLPPLEYMYIVKNNPNYNKARPDRISNVHSINGHQVYGNFEHRPWMFNEDLTKPMTPERLRELGWWDENNQPTQYLLSMEVQPDGTRYSSSNTQSPPTNPNDMATPIEDIKTREPNMDNPIKPDSAIGCVMCERTDTITEWNNAKRAYLCKDVDECSDVAHRKGLL